MTRIYKESYNKTDSNTVLHTIQSLTMPFQFAILRLYWKNYTLFLPAHCQLLCLYTLLFVCIICYLYFTLWCMFPFFIVSLPVCVWVCVCVCKKFHSTNMLFVLFFVFKMTPIGNSNKRLAPCELNLTDEIRLIKRISKMFENDIKKSKKLSIQIIIIMI